MNLLRKSQYRDYLHHQRKAKFQLSLVKIKTGLLENLLIKSNMHSGGRATGAGAGAGRKVNPNASYELQVKICQCIHLL